MASTSRPNRLSDPSFIAAQHVAACGDRWSHVDAPPEGEVLWREDGDQVVLMLDGWLVYVGPAYTGFYTKRLRATPELVAAMRGGCS